jgi:hypothetical protein
MVGEWKLEKEGKRVGGFISGTEVSEPGVARETRIGLALCNISHRDSEKFHLNSDHGGARDCYCCRVMEKADQRTSGSFS